MKKIDTVLHFLYTLFKNKAVYLLGGYDGLLSALVSFMLANYILTIITSISNHKQPFTGSLKIIQCKLIIFVLIASSNILDMHIIQTNGFLRTAVILFYISNEGNSLLKNAKQLNIPIPKKLHDFFKQLL